MIKRICFLFIFLLAAAFSVPAMADENSRSVETPGLSHQEIMRLGERMYREGVLPSGKPMQAIVQGDIPVDGTSFTCVSCHQRSGLGSFEGGVVTPPTNGRSLYEPLYMIYKGFKVTSAPPLRPAYTDESLASVLRSGIDPAGRVLNRIMPRYMIEEADMTILISYLKSLSSEFSPGVSDSDIHFATVITDDTPPDERDAMLAPLKYYISTKNKQAKVYETDMSQARMAGAMLLSRKVARMTLSLSRWILKGPPDTWRTQLEEYYRKEPVFALLGGISKGEWGPVHSFSEDNRIPCILPITDFPVISDTDWYTLYFSKGFYLEGESAARYLNGMDKPFKDESLVMIVRNSREGRALYAGFKETWEGLGRRLPLTVTLNEGEALTDKRFKQVLDEAKPDVAVIWDGPEAQPAIEALSGSKSRPEVVMVSSGFLGKSMWALKEEARPFTYITYPFRLDENEIRYNVSLPAMADMKLTERLQRILKQSYITTLVLTQALMDMNGQYYRDNLLDSIGMSRNAGGMASMSMGGEVPEETFPLYKRLSFAAGQRYASKGCYIVQLTKGENPGLVAKSDWVIH